MILNFHFAAKKKAKACVNMFLVVNNKNPLLFVIFQEIYIETDNMTLITESIFAKM